MIQYHNINGRLVDASSAAVPVHDLGLIRGYGVFDYFLIEAGQPLFVDDYAARFLYSAQHMHLDIGLTHDQLKEQIFHLIEANGLKEGGMRLLATGGVSPNNFEPVQPNFMMLLNEAGGFPDTHYSKGAGLVSVNYQRDLPEVKTTNYTMGIKMLDAVKKAGAVEVLYHDGSFLRESVRANIFVVTRDERILTPASKILMGITRKQVLKIARSLFPVEEREVSVNELKEAKEVFITSSTKKVMPIVFVDDLQIGDGRPGAITKKLAGLFRNAVEDYLAAAVS
jgi:branched-subunit amino acid aminotransferase/4-amino-4-deoxychorismate lyase